MAAKRQRRKAILELSDNMLVANGVDYRKIDNDEFFDIISNLAMLFYCDSRIADWFVDYLKNNPDKALKERAKQ